jgi:ribosomal 50S subunit-recycling heat shock protein
VLEKDIVTRRQRTNKNLCFSYLRGETDMRLDKFLKVSRLIKRRTVANEACDAGRVLVNGKAAKASAQVKVGDVIEIQFGTRTVKAEVLDLQDTTKKEEAKELFRYL